MQWYIHSCWVRTIWNSIESRLRLYRFLLPCDSILFFSVYFSVSSLQVFVFVFFYQCFFSLLFSFHSQSCFNLNQSLYISNFSELRCFSLLAHDLINKFHSVHFAFSALFIYSLTSVLTGLLSLSITISIFDRLQSSILTCLSN